MAGRSPTRNTEPMAFAVKCKPGGEFEYMVFAHREQAVCYLDPVEGEPEQEVIPLYPQPAMSSPIAVIEVVGKPIAKRNRPAKFGDDKHKPWTAIVIAALCEHRLNGLRRTEVFRVDCLFRLARPKDHFRKGKHAGELKPGRREYCGSKPDRDNLDKAILDALTQCGFWVDDGQAADGRVRTKYCNPGESPGCTITIFKLED